MQQTLQAHCDRGSQRPWGLVTAPAQAQVAGWRTRATFRASSERKSAVALPIAMIRDGRVRSASVLEAKRQARSERRSRQPAEIQQRQEQEERPKRSEVLSQAPWDAKRQERQQLPLYELLGRGFQFQQTTQVAARRAGNYVVLISESMDNASMPGL